MDKATKKEFIHLKIHTQYSICEGALRTSDLAKYCKLDDNTQNILYKAIDRFALSNRAINKILKVARTIADLDDSKEIEKSHIMESFNYRKRI